MIRLIHTLGTVALTAALFTIPVGTGQGVALAQASCGGVTQHTNGNAIVPVPSTSNSSGNFNCIDGIGNSGPAVLQIQLGLNHCYGANLTTDSDSGSLTASAMKRA